MKSIVAPFVAGAIALSALSATAPAQAAPLGAVAAKEIQVTQQATTEVGYRGRRNAATAAGIVIGLSALALGAAAAANASRPVRRCYIETVEIWSPRRQANVYRDREVCR